METPAAEHPSPETLVVLYDEIGQALTGQHDYVEELNDRAQQLFGFAAVILTILAGLAPSQPTTFGKVVDLIAIPLFVLPAYFSARAWQFRFWRSDPDVTRLWEKYRLKTDEFLRHQVIQNRLASLKTNDDLITTKVRQIKTAQFLLYIGFGYLVALLLYRVFAASGTPEGSVHHVRHAAELLCACGRQTF